MSNYPKYLMESPIGIQGDIVIPPKTATEAGLGRLSQQNGWGVENSQPIEQGGIPPFRTDFNGVFFLLSQLVYWYQQPPNSPVIFMLPRVCVCDPAGAVDPP